MDIDYKAIGQRIREQRKSRKLTQCTLAELSSVEPSNISHIERGATKLSLPTLINIANALETTLDSLVYDSLKSSRHISSDLINKEIADCSDEELKAIVKIIKTTKDILNKKYN